MKTDLPSHLSDAALVAEVTRLARCEREATARLIAHLAELDARQLYLAAGFGSLFVYCTEVLRLSEHGTYNRIEAARAARRFPVLLEKLKEGALNLTTVRLLAPHLTSENVDALLDEAVGRSKRRVEELLARRFPLPESQPSVRKLPATKSIVPTLADGRPEHAVESALPLLPAFSAPQISAAAPPRRPVVSAVAPDRYEIRFTASASTREKLRLAQDLLRHAVPSGDPAEIIDRALTLLLEHVARRKFAATEKPAKGRATAPGSRHVPAAIKRAVWLRDQGRCAFVGKGGRRCGERAFVEFHHLEPYGIGGEPTEANIELRCRAHNAYEARLIFGPTALPTRPGASRSQPMPTRTAVRDGARSATTADP